MTATIKPRKPDESEPAGPPTRTRSVVRFSSMETLGFYDAGHTWSEPPRRDMLARRGRHEALVADWEPQEVGNRLSGSNVRWGLLAIVVMAVGALASGGFWLVQGSSIQAQSAIAQVGAQAETLNSALPTLDAFNESLLDAASLNSSGELFEVEAEARALFDLSSTLPQGEVDLRSASSQAASSALEAVRLASGARSFRSAVTPVLTVPDLETDPELIELDEAARSFGEWQMSFDAARTAVSDNILPEIGEELNLLSADLSSFLGRYVDALRLDDSTEAASVVSELGSRLQTIDSALTDAIGESQARVGERVGEARQALDRLLSS